MPKKTKTTDQTGQQTKQGFVSTKVEAPDIPDYVIVELRYESPVAFSASAFAAPPPPRRRQTLSMTYWRSMTSRPCAHTSA